jgi:hypothetical protein
MKAFIVKSYSKNGVGTVAETNLLSNLSCVNIVNSDVVLSEVTLYLVRDEVNQLLTIKDSVQQEETVLTQATSYIVHVEVSLYMASYESSLVFRERFNLYFGAKMRYMLLLPITWLTGIRFWMRRMN